MGEEVAQPSDVVYKNSAGSVGIDETDKATKAINHEFNGRKIIEKCEGCKSTNCAGCVNQLQAIKSPKKPMSVSSAKPQEVSFEKSRKWFNISFMHRAGNSSNSRSKNSSESKNSIKTDKNRHSWHLNDSSEM